jgi:Glycosyl transferase family 2
MQGCTSVRQEQGRRRRAATDLAPVQLHREGETRVAGRTLARVRGVMKTAPSMLSVVIPAKNEAASLRQLVAEIRHVLHSLSNRTGSPELADFEIVVVNDGSTDQTDSILVELAALYPELKALTLTTSAGQTGATIAGIRAARGTWIATLDADLQNDPADLARLWDALPGHDAALGWRVNRRDVWSRRAISHWANRLRNLVLGQSIRDTGCSVRIFSRELALRLPTFHGAHRFLGPLLLREGCRVVQVPVSHRRRVHGRSHYNLRNRSLQVVIDLLGVAWLMQRPVCYEVLDAYPRVEDQEAELDMLSLAAENPVVAVHQVALRDSGRASLPARHSPRRLGRSLALPGSRQPL